MPVFKGSMIISRGQAGWTESFFITKNDAPLAHAALKSLATQRRKSLTDQAFLSYVRVTNPDPPRDATFEYYPGFTGQGQVPAGAAGDPEVYTAAVNVRLFAGPGTWRSFLMRGLGDDAVDVTSAGMGVNGSFIASAKPFLDLLKADSWQIQKRTFGAPQGITDVAILGQRLFTFTTAAPLVGVVAGDVVQIQFAFGTSNLNGFWRIRTVNGAIYHVVPKPSSNLGLYSVNSGTARKVSMTYPAIDDYSHVGITSRRTGRPLYLPRGRRSARRR